MHIIHTDVLYSNECIACYGHLWPGKSRTYVVLNTFGSIDTCFTSLSMTGNKLDNALPQWHWSEFNFGPKNMKYFSLPINFPKSKEIKEQTTHTLPLSISFKRYSTRGDDPQPINQANSSICYHYDH